MVKKTRLFKRLQKAEEAVSEKKQKYRIALSKVGKGQGNPQKKEQFNTRAAALEKELAGELKTLIQHRRKLKIAYDNRKVSLKRTNF